MTDHSNTGDTFGHVADLLEAHDPHHGRGDVKWADIVPAPRCLAVHAHLAGGTSQHAQNMIKGILANANKGTVAQRQAARNWADFNKLRLNETSLSSAVHSFYDL